MKALFGIIVVSLAALLAVGIAALFAALPVWLLWDPIAVEIFGFKHISFLQALGISILCSCLFKTSVTSKDKS